MLWLKYTKSGRSWTRVHCIGSVFAEAGAHRLENRRGLPDLRMAVHARLGRRNAREGRGLDRGVTVPTVNAIVEHVMEMAELHRLLDVLLGARHVRRATEKHREPDQASDQQENACETDLGQGVGASMENLRHRRLVEWLTARIRREASRLDLYHVVKKGSSSRHAAWNPCATARFYAQTRQYI